MALRFSIRDFQRRSAAFFLERLRSLLLPTGMLLLLLLLLLLSDIADDMGDIVSAVADVPQSFVRAFIIVAVDIVARCKYWVRLCKINADECRTRRCRSRRPVKVEVIGDDECMTKDKADAPTRVMKEQTRKTVLDEGLIIGSVDHTTVTTKVGAATVELFD